MAHPHTSQTSTPDIAVAELRPDFIDSKRHWCMSATVRNYRWALNFHQEVQPLLCWQPQEVVHLVGLQQQLRPSVRQLLYDCLAVFYAWARPWVKAHYPGAADLPSLPWMPYSRWSKDNSRNRRQRA